MVIYRTRPTLETFIRLNNTDTHELRQLLTEFPKLRKLEAACAAFVNFGHQQNDLVLPINTTIKELNLKCWDFEDDENHHSIHQEVLTAVPRLELLEIDQLPMELMEFIALNLKSLKKLKYTEVEDGALERYEAMKIDEIQGLNRDIECSEV
jgi:hypothetical protein